LTGQSIAFARVAKRTPIGNNRGVLQSVFPLVVFGAVALSIVMSLVFLFSRGSAYDQIGDSGFAPERDPGEEMPAPAPGSSAERSEQETEIRQMLRARSARLARRGEPALDIEAEVARLLAPGERATRDPGIELEVRQLVIARNERRSRQGLEQLDVESEVVRTLQELDP
jgi:hypothetical protein